MIGLAVFAAFILFLHYDVAMMRFRYDWLGEEGARGIFKQILVSLRDFSQLLPIIVALIIVATVDRRRWTIIAVVLLAQLLASMGYNAGKGLLVRHRPYAAIRELAPLSELSGWQTWNGWQPGNFNNDYRSFPSGHSAAAFAFAAVMGWFYPPLRWLFWTLATGCAASRYLDAVHWPSDCLAGAIMGYVAAWLALRPHVWTLPVTWCRRCEKRQSTDER